VLLVLVERADHLVDRVVDFGLRLAVLAVRRQESALDHRLAQRVWRHPTFAP
jgi:hypothetical protein